MNTRRTPGHRRGSILILVLWITLGLVTVALVYGHTALLELRAAQSRAAGWQAEQAIEAGLRYAFHLIGNQENTGAIPDLEEYQSGPVDMGEATFWYLGRASLQTREDRPVFSLQDESARLDLNTATLEMLEKLPDMTPQLAAAIIDWRDEDDEPEENGAESDTYLQRDPPHPAKNAPFDSIEELRLLHGADPFLLEGEDHNRNGVLDPNENDGDLSWPPDNSDGTLDPGILEYVTVHTAPGSAGSPDGIDLNDVREDELDTLLEETFGASRAEEIRTPGNNDDFDSLLEYYRFSRMTPEEFAQVEHRLMVTGEEDEPVSPVNVNTASAEVLACLPGLDESLAADIVSHRTGNEPGTATLAWIAEVSSLDEDALSEAGPHLTGTTTRYRIDIAATGRHGRGYRRVIFVIDTAGEEPRILSRRTLPRAGWALGEGTRLELTRRTLDQEDAW